MSLLDSRLTHAVIGYAIGDALGLPVRQTALASTVDEMKSYGVFNQPAGTYSDETGLVLAGMSALMTGFSEPRILKAYQDWWQGRGFNSTLSPQTAPWPSVTSALAGNDITLIDTSQDPGALIRVLPLAFYFAQSGVTSILKAPTARRQLTRFVHLTSPDQANLIASTLYVQALLLILAGEPLADALPNALADTVTAYAADPLSVDFALLDHLTTDQVKTLAAGPPTPRNILAIVWHSLLTTTDFRPAVLGAIHTGGYTDTVGALTGGLAGPAYGYQRIPHHWCLTLTRYSAIVTAVREAEDSPYFAASGA